MRLREWLEREGVSYADFGVILGRSGEAVRRYALGERIPDRETMPRIVDATRSEVTANDFFDMPPSSDVLIANKSGDASSPDIAAESIGAEVPEPDAVNASAPSGRMPAASCEGLAGASAVPATVVTAQVSIGAGAADDTFTRAAG